jgi:hypothetical protein
LRFGVQRLHLVTSSSVTATRRVHRSQRDSRRLATMRAHRQDDGRISEGEREAAMWNDAATAIRVLAGCVLGGCFAVAVIVSTALG